MKRIVVFCILISVLLSACTPSISGQSSERKEVVVWASQIADIETRAELVMERYSTLQDKAQTRRPTQSEYDQLFAAGKEFNEFYNELNNLYSPLVAREIHLKWIESYAEMSNSMAHYISALRTNEITYIEKSREAAQEGNRLAGESYMEFEKLLDQYSISCQEINFCE